MPRSYADRFAQGVAGRAEVRFIAGAGHLGELDRPREVADAVLSWTD